MRTKRKPPRLPPALVLPAKNMYWISISFLLLAGTSLLARRLRLRAGAGPRNEAEGADCNSAARCLRPCAGLRGFAIFTLGTVPMICAFMGAALALWLALLARFQGGPARPYALLLPPFAILAAGFAFHVLQSRKIGISAVYAALSFAAGFAYSIAVSLAVAAAILAVRLNTWQGVEIPSEPKCELQMRALATLCPEFDRRIAFESGKRVGIWADTCGLDKFAVYKLKSGAIYLKCTVAHGSSYIIDPKGEKVYEVLGESATELKGGLICGRYGGAVVPAVYETYGRGGRNGEFESSPIPAGNLIKGGEFAGMLSRRGFAPAGKAERTPRPAANPAAD